MKVFVFFILEVRLALNFSLSMGAISRTGEPIQSMLGGGGF